jgi:hypothetical protein
MDGSVGWSSIALTVADGAVFGQAAIRQGSWKAVWLPPPTGNDKWLLFDLSVGGSLVMVLSFSFANLQIQVRPMTLPRRSLRSCRSW